MSTGPVVVLGAGHAGVQVAASLRDAGYDGGIVVVGEETALPYQRPVLSKSFLAKPDSAPLPLRGAAFYEAHDIDLRLGTSAVSIDRAHRRVELAEGAALGYSHLVLATGARPRSLPLVPPGTAGIHLLRSVTDAAALRDHLGTAGSVVVIGGGFLGLEAAAVAAQLGLTVTVIDVAPTLMGRSVSPAIGAAFERAHLGAGVRLLLDNSVAEFGSAEGRVRTIATTTGEQVAADLVLVSVGADPEDSLAAAAGLQVADGVLVDDHLRTSDPDVSAIGDCARWTTGERSLRRESVQNATDQARCVAARLAGDPRPYRAVPWFWSEQGAAKLQIVGVRAADDVAVVRGDAAEARFSVFHFAAGRLTCVESISRPGDHVVGRKLLESGATVTPEEAADTTLDLRALLAARIAAAA